MKRQAEDKIVTTAKRILELAGFEAEVDLVLKPKQILLEVKTQPAGLLIGKQGQNLKAFERILQVIFYHSLQENKTLTVDVAGFRQKRAQLLEERVRRAIEEVLTTKRPYTLEGLTAAERKAVHLKVAATPGLSSESQGTGVARVLTILPRR